MVKNVTKIFMPSPIYRRDRRQYVLGLSVRQCVCACSRGGIVQSACRRLLVSCTVKFITSLTVYFSQLHTYRLHTYIGLLTFGSKGWITHSQFMHSYTHTQKKTELGLLKIYLGKRTEKNNFGNAKKSAYGLANGHVFGDGGQLGMTGL